MNTYHKIQTVYLRDPGNNYKTLLDGRFAKPEFEYLKENTWTFTEKVDGTNIRVIWDGESVAFRGKTDRAQTPKFLLEKLETLFNTDLLRGFPPMCLYGEGYGAKIQKGGGNYIPDGQGFILFDVLINENWQERNNVIDIADELNIKYVPIIGTGTLLEGVELVRNGFASELMSATPEGLVMRPTIELKNRSGNRIITKIKAKDFRK